MRKASRLKRRNCRRHSGEHRSSTWVLLGSAAGSSLWATHPAYGQAALYWGGSGTPAGSGSSPSGTWAAGSLNWSSDQSGNGGGSFSDGTTTSNNLTFGTALATGSFTVTIGDSEGAGNITFATRTITLGGQLDVVYNATPEPGTAMLLLTGAGPMLMTRRRKARVK